MKNSLHSYALKEAQTHDTLSKWDDFMQSMGIKGKIAVNSRSNFSANFSSFAFGKSKIAFYKASPFAHDRTKSHCLQNPTDCFLLSWIKNGLNYVKQGGKEAMIGENDCYILSLDTPAYHKHSFSLEGTSILIPRSFLQRWLPFRLDLAATSLSEASAFGKPLASLLGALTPASLGKLAVPPDMIVEQICCLLSLIAGPTPFISSTYRHSAYHRLLHSLQAHCCDPDFDESVLAKEHNLSKRTIQATFSCAGTNFKHELLSRRMERAKGLLDDPRYDKKSIAEIASILGYKYASHFIGHFRKTFGIPPAAYRKIHAE